MSSLLAELEKAENEMKRLAQIVCDLTMHNERLVKEVTRLRRAIMLDTTTEEAKWTWSIDDAD